MTYLNYIIINLINDVIIHLFSLLSKMMDQSYTKHLQLLKSYHLHDALNNYIQFSILYELNQDHLLEAFLKNHPKLIFASPNYSHFSNDLVNSNLLKKNFHFKNLLTYSMD